MDNKVLWQAVLGELEVGVSRASFKTWFKNTAIVANEEGRIIVAVPNIFTKEWLEKKYGTSIKAALTKLVGDLKSIEYKVGAGAKAPSPAPVTATTRAVAQMVDTKPAQPQLIPTAARANNNLNTRYTFESYVVGSSNQLAYAACQGVAKSPGSKYNPLFLYGGVGLGKTHLMQAVGNEIIRRDPSKRVEYVTSDNFTNEFVSSISRKKTEDFTSKYRNVDVLIIDDMQFLAGKEKTQEEFFHIFNHLHQANKQIIISSDKPPKAIPTLEDRLRSRFEMGMTADIGQPDLETRSAILQNKSAARGMVLPNDLVEWMARHIQHNIRELEGALTQLAAHCELHGVEPSIAVASVVLGNIAASKPKLKPLSAKSILEKTASYYDLTTVDLMGPKRDKEIVVPRQVAMYLMRHEMNLSFPKIAAACGGRDHTTAIHSVGKIEKNVEVDENLRNEISLIKERLFM